MLFRFITFSHSRSAERASENVNGNAEEAGQIEQQAPASELQKGERLSARSLNCNNGWGTRGG